MWCGRGQGLAGQRKGRPLPHQQQVYLEFVLPRGLPSTLGALSPVPGIRWGRGTDGGQPCEGASADFPEELCPEKRGWKAPWG